jgi:hypothetical protein
MHNVYVAMISNKSNQDISLFIKLSVIHWGFHMIILLLWNL